MRVVLREEHVSLDEYNQPLVSWVIAAKESR